MSFPKDFVWGAAAAAYQVEGAAFEDGKGLTVWDMLCRKPGAIWQNQDGFTACDHYHRFKEDVAIMKAMKLQAYRLSIAWARVIPDGVGAVNEKGLSFYDRLIDELLAAGITPYVTLFHWDFPYALYCKGGWMNRDSVEWFADYTRLIADRFSDRVKHWMTLNEPQCFIGLGHLEGKHAPGDKLDLPEVLLAGHHALMAHGRSVQVLRERSRQPCEIGYAPVGVVRHPLTESPADIETARVETFAIRQPNCWNNTWWMDPVFFGHYPEDGLKLFGKAAPKVLPGDMELIKQKVDFFGTNIYMSVPVKAGANGIPEYPAWPLDTPTTAFRWPVTPQALYWGPKFFQERYKLPVYITENGMSNNDIVSLDGQIHDPQRIDFLNRYLRELKRAMDEGVDVRGYFQWSIMDNFEWAEGYKERFGLVYVDYVTQKRTPKDSARWYTKVIEANGANL